MRAKTPLRCRTGSNRSCEPLSGKALRFPAEGFRVKAGTIGLSVILATRGLQVAGGSFMEGVNVLSCCPYEYPIPRGGEYDQDEEAACRGVLPGGTVLRAYGLFEQRACRRGGEASRGGRAHGGNPEGNRTLLRAGGGQRFPYGNRGHQQADVRRRLGQVRHHDAGARRSRDL